MSTERSKNEFMHTGEVSKLLGFSRVALKTWRKKCIGPRWRRAAKKPHFSHPLYYREDVERLHAALGTIRSMKLRPFPNARLPTPPSDPPPVVALEEA